MPSITTFGRTRPEAIPFDDTNIFDSDSIAKLAFLPKSVCISGAGIIAIEFAKIFAKLHCSVTMLVRGEAEASLRKLGLDEALVHGLLDDLKESGVNILSHTSATSYTKSSGGGGAPLSVALKGADGKPPPCAPRSRASQLLRASAATPRVASDRIGS